MKGFDFGVMLFAFKTLPFPKKRRNDGAVDNSVDKYFFVIVYAWCHNGFACGQRLS